MLYYLSGFWKHALSFQEAVYNMLLQGYWILASAQRRPRKAIPIVSILDVTMCNPGAIPGLYILARPLIAARCCCHPTDFRFLLFVFIRG